MERRCRHHRITEDAVIQWVFLAIPALVLVFVFGFPLLSSFYWSLTDYQIGRQELRFIGLGNYERLVTDSRTLQSLLLTLKFTIGAFALQFVVGFALALVVDYIHVLKGFVRTLIIVPLMATPIVLGAVWRVMLNYDFGIVNYLVGALGIPPQGWVTDPVLAMPTLIVVDTWLTAPFVMLVISAGLASLPQEPFESAKIDGASSWQTFRYLTLPMLQPVILVVATFRLNALLRAFDLPFSLTTGGPARATEVLSYHIYTRWYLGFQAGYSSAVSFMLLALSLVVVLALMKSLDPLQAHFHIRDAGASVARAYLGRLLLKLMRPLAALLQRTGDTLAKLTAVVGGARIGYRRKRHADPAGVSCPRGQAAGLFTNYRSRQKILKTVASVMLCAFVVIQIFPIYWIYASSLKEPPDVFASPPKWIFTPTTHNYEVVLGLKYGTEAELSMFGAKPALSKLPQYLLNSLVISTGTTVIALLLATLAAYVLVRFRIRGKRIFLTAVLATRMVPTVIIALPIFLIWRTLHLVDTYWGLVVAYLSFSLPFGIWMMRGYLTDLPVELEEAAMVDGCTRLGSFARITVPLVAPGLSATAVFTFIGCWNEFLFAVVLASGKTKPVTVEILTYISEYAILFGRLFAAAGLVLLPVLVFTLVVQKNIVTGLTGGALKG